MSIRNKIRVCLYLGDDCSQEKGEVTISWEPINFMVYSDLFPEIIAISIDNWLGDNAIDNLCEYELIFEHIMVNDGGVITEEYFKVIHVDQCSD